MVSRVALTLCVSLLVGCATPISTERRATLDELNRMQLDCPNRDLQIAWLERQLKINDHAIGSQTGAIGTAGAMINGTYDERKAVYERDWNARARSIIWQLRSSCGSRVTVYR